MNDYRPIACGAYDEIELMAMRRVLVSLVFLHEDGARREIQGQVVDTAIRDGAEYLVLESAGKRLQIRLDRIVAIQQEDTGAVWRQ